MASDNVSTLREWRLRLMLVAFSLLLALAGAEIALRLLGIGAAGPPRDSGGLTFFSHHPRLGWDLVPGARDVHRGEEFEVEIRITPQGLRSPRVYPPAPPPGLRRVVVLGDSFTFGHGVEVEEAWPSLLEAARPDLETVNLAVTGYGTDQQLLRFEDRADDFAPDAVVLGLFVGNVFRNARFEQLGYAKPRFELDGGELRLVGVPVPAELPRPSGPRVLRLLSGGARTVSEHLGFGEAWAVTGAILERLQAESAERGAPLFVVILPKDRLIYGGGPRLALHERTHERLHALLDARDLPYLDLVPALRQRAAAEPGERLYYPRDGHWTVAGHRAAADAVAAWLLERLPPAQP